MDNWFQATKLRLQFFAIFLTVGCPCFLIWMAPTAKRQIETYSWSETPGVVRAVITKQSVDNKNKPLYYGRVAYSYTVDGKGYTSDLTDLGPGSKRSDERMALEDVKDYRSGDKVPVYYDPADPSIAVIEKGVPKNHMILLTVIPILWIISIAAAFFAIRSWMRAIRPSIPADPAA